MGTGSPIPRFKGVRAPKYPATIRAYLEVIGRFLNEILRRAQAGIEFTQEEADTLLHELDAVALNAPPLQIDFGGFTAFD